RPAGSYVIVSIRRATPAATFSERNQGTPHAAPLRQFTNPHAAIFDRSSLAFQTQVAFCRNASCAAGTLHPIHPQTHLTVDRPDVVMIPLQSPFAAALPRKAARAIRRNRRERRHLRFTRGKDIP